MIRSKLRRLSKVLYSGSIKITLALGHVARETKNQDIISITRHKINADAG